MTVFEICVETLEAARAAGAGAADRIELCADLASGGVTPAPELLREVLAEVAIPVHAMVRVRAGPFTADAAEARAMEEQVGAAREAGAQGVVLGLLDARGRVDRARVARLVERARPMSVTFHRAFDEACDPAEALETLVELGVDRVLTSGGAAAAIDACAAIRGLVARARGRIVVMAGGGVRPENWRRLVEETGVPEVHASVALKPPGAATSSGRRSTP